MSTTTDPTTTVDPASTAAWIAGHDPLPVVSWDDDGVGFDGRSGYVETYWLAVLGPSSILTLRRLTDWLEDSPSGVVVGLEQLALSLGLGHGTGRNAPVVRTLHRLVGFGVARIAWDAYAVRATIPPLSGSQLRRLPRTSRSDTPTTSTQPDQFQRRRRSASDESRSGPASCGEADAGPPTRSGGPRLVDVPARSPGRARAAMSTLNVILNGARGGQGTSTVAAVLALCAAGHVDTELVATEPAATAALLGITLHGETTQVADRLILAAAPTATSAVRIIDTAHAGPDPAEAAVRLVVLRGPCYLALRTLVTNMPAADGIVVVAEPGRSLTARDVAEVAGVPVVATVAASPTIARTIDAGLLCARLHRLAEFAPLARYLTHLLGQHGVLARSDELPAAHRGRVVDLNDRSPSCVDMTGTDSPLPQGADH